MATQNLRAFLEEVAARFHPSAGVSVRPWGANSNTVTLRVGGRFDVDIDCDTGEIIGSGVELIGLTEKEAASLMTYYERL